MHQATVKEFASWTSLRSAYEKLLSNGSTSQKKLWIFRGQREESWPLKSSLDRALEKYPSCRDQWCYWEEGLVRQFQRYLNFVESTSDKPPSDNILAWLALMQHHGTPTRLLDWTYSFYVALYFAIENATGDAAVYAIDGRWCNRASRKLLPDPANNAESIIQDPYITKSESFRSMFSRMPELPIIYRVNTFILNERLATQQGLFLCPGSLKRTFEENLADLQNEANEPAPLHKWIIKKSLRDRALKELSYMNIDRHSLFPGIDGFAQSLIHHIGQDRLVPPWRKKLRTAPYENWLDWQSFNF